jgi:predicted permease
MLIIGASMSAAPLKRLLTSWKTYILCLSKLILTPVVVFFILRIFITDPVIIGVSTVMAATPIAVISTMLCIRYDGSRELSSAGVFISTLLSVVTIPLICTLLLR